MVTKDGTGNIETQDGSDISLDDADKRVMLLYDGTNWRVLSQPPSSGGGELWIPYEYGGGGAIAILGDLHPMRLDNTQSGDFVGFTFKAPADLASISAAVVVIIPS